MSGRACGAKHHSPLLRKRLMRMCVHGWVVEERDAVCDTATIMFGYLHHLRLRYTPAPRA